VFAVEYLAIVAVFEDEDDGVEVGHQVLELGVATFVQFDDFVNATFNL
jgi:hypothetical protein